MLDASVAYDDGATEGENVSDKALDTVLTNGFAGEANFVVNGIGSSVSSREGAWAASWVTMCWLSNASSTHPLSY